jgi:hypothetical protein
MRGVEGLTLAMEQLGFYNPHHHAVMDHAVEPLDHLVERPLS